MHENHISAVVGAGSLLCVRWGAPIYMSIYAAAVEPNAPGLILNYCGLQILKSGGGCRHSSPFHRSLHPIVRADSGRPWTWTYAALPASLPSSAWEDTGAVSHENKCVEGLPSDALQHTEVTTTAEIVRKVPTVIANGIAVAGSSRPQTLIPEVQAYGRSGSCQSRPGISETDGRALLPPGSDMEKCLS